MSNKKTVKQQITEAVLDQLAPTNEPVEKIINDWWFTKSGGGLRLTPMGDMLFRQAEIEFFDMSIEVKQHNWHKFVIDCSKKIKCPYYIGVNKDELKKSKAYIRLYDSKIAMVMQLYGDIHSYLDSVKSRN